jgi:hypothetical protein
MAFGTMVNEEKLGEEQAGCLMRVRQTTNRRDALFNEEINGRDARSTFW